MVSAKFSQINQLSSHYYESANCGSMIDWSTLLLTTTVEPPFEWPSPPSHLHQLSFPFPIPQRTIVTGGPSVQPTQFRQLPEWFQLADKKRKKNVGKTIITNYNNNQWTMNGRKLSSRYTVSWCDYMKHFDALVAAMERCRANAKLAKRQRSKADLKVSPVLERPLGFERSTKAGEREPKNGSVKKKNKAGNWEKESVGRVKDVKQRPWTQYLPWFPPPSSSTISSMIRPLAKKLVDEEEALKLSTFEVCTGYYGQCSPSHSCASGVACLHKVTHEPCCVALGVSKHCPSVDAMGYECRKMNPVNWCNCDEECGTSAMQSQVCCPTGCGYNTCLNVVQRSPTKSKPAVVPGNGKTVKKIDHLDCPNPSLIPVNCAVPRPVTWCNVVDDCPSYRDRKPRRCCPTQCGYSICLTRLVDRWLIS